MAKNLNNWCKAVRKAMIDEDLSVTELAQRVGKARSYVSAVINGRVVPRCSNGNNIVSAISDELNIDNTAYTDSHSD
jgi:predicted transcriptional regulator